MPLTLYPWQHALWHHLFSEYATMPHALLLTGKRGLGKLDFAKQVTQTLLCEANQQERPCGECPSCHWLLQLNHPDFKLLETNAATADSTAEVETKSTSSQITIQQVKELIDFSTVSSHREGLKIAVICPAEAMNLSAANALLKTLEEPPANVLFILVSHQPHRLLPTIRSRCLTLKMLTPEAKMAELWLQSQGITHPEKWLARASYAPLEALRMAELATEANGEGMIHAITSAQPFDILTVAETFQKTELTELIDSLQKWTYDLLSLKMNGTIRYYPDFAATIKQLVLRINLRELLACQQALIIARQTAQHPLNARLVLEQLLFLYKKCYL